MWYEPDLSLFSDMILMFGKNKLISMVEELFSELKKEGLEPDTRAYTELIGAYLQVDMIEKAMETYESMKASGCAPDKLTLTILIRNLESAGEEELAASVKKDCSEYLDSPKKFLKEVERKFVSKLFLSRQTFQLSHSIFVASTYASKLTEQIVTCTLYIKLNQSNFLVIRLLSLYELPYL